MMIKKIVFTAVLAVFAVSLFAQNKKKFKFGVRGGVSTTEIAANDLFVTNAEEMNELQIGIQEANYGYHFGFFAQARAGSFFIQPEVLFNSNTVDFKVVDLTVNEAVPEILNEKYQYIDIPVMLGFKLFNTVRLQGGPVGHVYLNNASELVDIEGYEDKFEQFTYGYQAGLGLDFWKLVIDLKYEGNFNNFGSHINIDGRAYEFNQAPTRLVASVGIAF
jgi:hypothetical protein